VSALYHKVMYDFSQPVPSLWESGRHLHARPQAQPLTADETCDVAVIGGGYCGLSAAYHLALQGADVRVLEAGDIGWGASGRNGGFCSIGASFLGPTEIASHYGTPEAMKFYAALADSVRLVEALAAEEGIDLQRQGDGVWTFAHNEKRLGDLEAQAGILVQAGVAAEVVDRAAFRERAFDCTEQAGALYEPVGFGLNPLSYCLGLAVAAEKRGAVLHSRSCVTRRSKDGNVHLLETGQGSIRARKVIVATNGWLPEHLFPELAGRVLPIMSNITVTQPLPDSVLKAQGWRTENPAANTRNHLCYVRMLPGGRFMFGGRGDTSGAPRGLVAMRRLLERRRALLFPAFATQPTSHSWRGLIAATRRLTPAVGTLPSDPTVAYAFGCHGNGVAFMTWAGRALARLMSGGDANLPAAVSELPGRFPLPALRLWALRAMLLRAHVEDEWL
jgi:glycine/D-amino acid oxidase-like deaminating enzyme